MNEARSVLDSYKEQTRQMTLAQKAAGKEGQFDAPRWKRIVQGLRARLLTVVGEGGSRQLDPGEWHDEPILQARASALLHAVYERAATEPCGRCKRCLDDGHRVYPRKLTLPWCVMGDVLLTLKGRNVNRARRAQRAPQMVDPEVLRERLKRRRRRAELAALGADGDADEADGGGVEMHDEY